MAPRLSIVVAGSRPEGPSESIFRTLGALAAAGELEVIVATTRSTSTTTPAGVRVVTCAAGSTIPELRLAGVRAATAPLIAVTEDFCAPSEGWLEALLEARQRVQAEVLGGPIDRRQGAAAGWALTFAEYGRFFRREPEGPVADLSSINVAYDANCLRAALGEAASGLYEVDVHARLRAAGCRFWRVPGMVMFDESRQRLASAARAQFHHGRFYAGERLAGLGSGQRLLRAAVTPGVPLLLFGRIAREAAAAGRRIALARSAPSLCVLLVAWAIGEAVGALRGPGQSGARWT